MKRTCLLMILTCLSGPLLGQQRAPAKRIEGVIAVAPSETIDPVPADIEPRATVIQYTDKDIVRIRTKLRYTTLIVLPKTEQILDFTCGDKEFWVIDGSQNLAYVKPAKAGAQTNLNLVTASGNIYSFLLAEVSGLQIGDPDLKVFVESRDETVLSAAVGPPRFVSSQVVDDYRVQIELAKAETRQVKEAAQAAIDRGVNQFVLSLRFPYRFEADKKPFWVRAIYTDARFTYIQARPEEAPAVYELTDGKPNLVNFKYQNGMYVVEKVLEQGYLVIGKAKLSFKRED